MGNLKLSKNGKKGENITEEKINEDPAPVKTAQPETTTGGNNDLPLKRKLAEYLLASDLNVFKKHLGEVRTLNDEKFNELFEGNTECIYGVQDEKGFRQLAQKFDDNKDLIYECYEKEEYFKYASQIWRPNILQALKEANSETKKNEILKKYKIDISLWDPAMQEQFNIIINTAPIKSLADRMVNYIQTDYGNFDELIKNVDKCEKNMQKDKDSYCNKAITSNLETSMSRIIDVFVPNFLKQLSTGVSQIPSNIKKAEESRAIKEIIKRGVISKNNKKKLINTVKKIYKERNKDSTLFGYNEEYKKLKELSKKFNDEDDKYYAFGHGKIYFKEMGLKDKASVAFGNKMVKHALLGLSMVNLTYSVMHLTKTFMDYKSFQEQFRFRLDEIRQKFIRHQSEVKVITEETDVDKAVELIIECGKKFNQDLSDVENLIADIQNAMNGVKTETNKSILNLMGSGGGLLIAGIGATVTKGEDRFEYASASLADMLGFITNIADIKEQKKYMKKYCEDYQQAVNLKTEILNEINNLKNKFYELSGKHFT